LMLLVLAKHLDFLLLRAAVAYPTIVARRDISREFPPPFFRGALN
jgi:hypothetical protein